MITSMPLMMRGPPGESGKDGRDGKDGMAGKAINENALSHLTLLRRALSKKWLFKCNSSYKWVTGNHDAILLLLTSGTKGDKGDLGAPGSLGPRG